MTRYACPICGDPSTYILWIDPEPPTGCPEGDHVKAVTECRSQMARARQAAQWRRACPEAFDERGNMKKGMLAKVLESLPPGTKIIPPGGIIVDDA